MTNQPYEPTRYRTTAAELTPSQERTWGSLSHLVPAIATVCSVGLLGFVASLVIYLQYRDRGPFVRAAAANSLNVQITTLIWLVLTSWIWFPLMFVGVGFLIYGGIFAVAVVLHVIGAIRAKDGQWYNPPLTPRFVK
jgi:uncharacterized Tic20 family protein